MQNKCTLVDASEGRMLPLSAQAPRVCDFKFIFLFLNQNICCRYSKEPSQCNDSFEHPKQMLKLMNLKIHKFMLNFLFFIPIIYI